MTSSSTPESPLLDATPVGEPAPATRSPLVPGAIVIGLLCAAFLGLAFQSGAYSPDKWLPFLVGMGALALVLVVAGPVIDSSRFQKIILAVLAAQVAWTAASVVWAKSLGNVWEETNRTLLYATAVVLTFAAVRWAGEKGLTILASLLTVAIGAVALTAIVTLAVVADPERLFQDARLDYPVTYFNGLACLLMVGFWLALGLANGARCAPPKDPDEIPVSRLQLRAHESFPRWTQPLLLALAVVFLQTTQMTQSRGAFWAFFLALPFFVILSPHRFRAVLDLAIVITPVVVFWDRLNGVYFALNDQTPVGTAVGSALTAIGYSAAIVVGAWLVTWLVERRIGALSRKARVWMGVVLIVLTIFGAVGGIVYADISTGGLDGYLSDRWEEFTSDTVGDAGGGSRFAAVGLNGRLTMWKVAANAFAEEPALGVGAQNFEQYFYLHRTTQMEVRQPHSQPMQLLAELGSPGLALYLLFVGLALVRALVRRFRSSQFTRQAVVAAVVVAVISWFIHSSADWMWQLAGVSLPAMLLLGALVAVDPAKKTPTATGAPEDVSDPPARIPKRSHVSRAIAGLLAVIVIASAAFPYVSSRFSDMAEGAEDGDTVNAWTETAAMLDPTSVKPFSVRANAYVLAAQQAPAASAERLVQLQLAADAWINATEVEPSGWSYYYESARTLLEARDAALLASSGFDSELVAKAQELEEQARTLLEKAKRLNPLSSYVKDLEEESLQDTGGI
jgi:hypothetical protein